MSSEKEKLLDTYPIPITMDSTRKILEQMEKSIFKISNSNGKGTGFFCYIFHEGKNLPVLITNNHVIDEKIINEESVIRITLNDDKITKIINIEDNRKIYTSPEDQYDTTIIELKPEKDDINKDNFLELDESIFEGKPDLCNKNIYTLQYPKYFYDMQKAAVSYGILKELKDKYNINHLCSTEKGSSGSPILNLNNNKVIGVHKESAIHSNFNVGTFLKGPIKEYLNNKNIITKNRRESDFSLNYEIIKKIGGHKGYNSVYKVKFKKTNEEKAIKIFNLDKISFMNPNQINNEIKEIIENMKIFEGKNKENENALKCYGCYKNKNELVIVMDLYEKNLEKYYLERNNPFNYEEIRELLLQLNLTFRIMIQNKILIKTFGMRHILIKQKNNKTFYCFNNIGASNLNTIVNVNYSLYVTSIPKLNFSAPELSESKKYSNKSFLWSLGALIYSLCFKEYNKNMNFHPFFKVDSLEKTGYKELDDLIQQLLIKDPNKRITWDQYFLHPFFKQ